MKRAYLVCLCLTAAQLSAQSNPVLIGNQSAKSSPPSATQPDLKAQSQILSQYGKLPLAFEANHGQADPQVKFLSRTPAYTLFLTGDEAVLTLPAKKTNQSPHRPTAARLPLANGTRPVAANESSLVSGYRFSDTATPEKSNSPSGVAHGPESAPVLRMKLRNANSTARIIGANALPGTSNYFIGNDPSKWRTNVPTYAKVKYEEIYSGIDLVYYGNQRQLEYDFIVSPGADPHRITFDIRGAMRIRKDAQGALVFKVGEGEIRWHKPVGYQVKDGARHLVEARYAITDTNRVGFELAKYDASKPLYIDPLIYSTYLGGSSYEGGGSLAVDSVGNAYVTSVTGSVDFPTTLGAFQTTSGGEGVAFVTKINPQGTALVYSTYLGGSGSSGGSSIAVDVAGNAYVTGGAGAGFPVTPGAFQTTFGGGSGDAFVTKINPAGTALIYSTYLGGSGQDAAAGIALDSSGNASVTGSTASNDFPTINALQASYGGGDFDAFVAKLNPTGTALIYSSYLGGSGQDLGQGIALDSAGDVHVVGLTTSTNFPVSPGAFQTVCNGGSNCQYLSDAFVTKLNPKGTAFVYSTYLGGSGEDAGGGITVDSAGDAYVTGSTESIDFPVTPGAFQAECGSECISNAFVTKFNPTGSALVYSTYLGSYYDGAAAIAVDVAGDAYVTGVTHSADFPITPGALQIRCGSGRVNCGRYSDAFVTELNAAGSALVYSTFLGGNKQDDGSGIVVDSLGNAYVAGGTDSTNFPTKNPFQKRYGGDSDSFVAKLDMRAGTTTALSSSPNPSAFEQPVTFTAVVTSAAGPPPDGETVSFMKGKTVLGTGTLSGGSASFTTSTLKVGTNSITAVYVGDSNFAGSKSKPVKQVVEKSKD